MLTVVRDVWDGNYMMLEEPLIYNLSMYSKFSCRTQHGGGVGY